MHNGEIAKALTLYVVGFASVLMVYSIYTHIRTLQSDQPERGRRRRDKWESNKKRRLEDGMCPSIDVYVVFYWSNYDSYSHRLAIIVTFNQVRQYQPPKQVLFGLLIVLF
jgi:hypothetical protein